LFHNIISIGARNFAVELRKSDFILDTNEDVKSYIDHYASLIVVREMDGASEDAYEELIFHEIMHAIIKNAGLDMCLKEGFSEEFLVSALAPRIHDFVKKNVCR
jgi:hypothetical protein